MGSSDLVSGATVKFRVASGSPEEIAVCEKVTGFSYDRLWNRDNALKMKQ